MSVGTGLLAVPQSLCAQRYLTVGTGTSLTFFDIVQRIITFLAGGIAAVSTAMFVVGAFFVVLSGVQEDYKQKGKDLMIGSILALGIVAGAYAILRTVDYFLS